MQLRQDGFLAHNKTGHDQCFAEVDADMIREAIVNLLSNAMRYTDVNGLVSVTVSESRGDVVISVSDTGIGIAKD